MKKEFLIIDYKADDDKVIKDIRKIKVDDIREAFEETQNNFTNNIVIPKNKKNKREIAKLLKAFD